MAFRLKKKSAPGPVPDPAGTAAGTAADVEAVMKKYDRESNVRVWEGTPQKALRVFEALVSFYFIWVTLPDKTLAAVHLDLFRSLVDRQKMMIFLGLILIIGYLNYPIKKGHVKVNAMPWYDVVFMLAGAIPCFYYAVNARAIIELSSKVTDDPKMVIMAIAAILSFVELCRRCVGLPILCVVGVLALYTFSTVRFGKVIKDLFYSTDGLMNTPISVCSKYIVVFIIFGAFLERTGISNFFINLANCAAGSSAGGPAKVAVISSALCGMVSGSSVGNTVTTGSVTIPMMKETGYKGEFAGAVEAAASTGGQIMPPIMGAAAFLMAEMTGADYSTVIARAILPAVLYFTGIYIVVHLEAKKLGLRGIPRSELPKFLKMLPKIYLLLPLVVLVYLVSTGSSSMQGAAAIAIVITVGVGILNNFVNRLTKNPDKSDELTFRKFVDALEAGAKSTITVAVACAMAGLVAGCVTSTGLGPKLISMVVRLSGGHAMIALMLTMVCCIILGMGVPTTANYCIMASTCAPILMSSSIGINMISAHFFVFYFGIVADITPPVALAAYAGSAIAKAPPMKTALNATKLAIAAFVVPYIFALNPAMLLVDVSAVDAPNFANTILMGPQVIQVVITSVLGILALGIGLEGYFRGQVPWPLRIVALAAGIFLIYPETISDVAGLAVIAGIFLYQTFRKRLAAGKAGS